MTLGKRMWHGIVFMSMFLVLVPAGVMVLGLASWRFPHYMFLFCPPCLLFSQVYSFLPGAVFNTYHVVDGEWGLPLGFFGIEVVLLYWLTVSVILGALLGVLRVPIGRKKSSEPTGSGYRPSAAGSA